MTGFGRAIKQCADFDITIDITSVNKKGFELSVSLPREWMPMERLVSQALKKTVARGKISFAARIEKKGGKAALSFDDPAVLDTLDGLKRACNKVGNLRELREDNNKKLDEMRRTEGAALKLDLTARLQTISSIVAGVEELSHGTAQKYKELLLQRLAAMNLELDPNDERVLKEICIFADKCDICEEITRLKSHIAQFLSTLNECDAVGRKMDFICQEMGREINTIASKANSLELTKSAIELKNELERIREQTQNVE